jgi:hypothetical protein
MCFTLKIVEQFVALPRSEKEDRWIEVPFLETWPSRFLGHLVTYGFANAMK